MKRVMLSVVATMALVLVGAGAARADWIDDTYKAQTNHIMKIAKLEVRMAGTKALNMFDRGLWTGLEANGYIQRESQRISSEATLQIQRWGLWRAKMRAKAQQPPPN
jgi:hypothetical protein